ncbi:MAG: UDP-3-O-acyl-N-acetylglucosamine deacetylase [Alphaproteobacteria bacterium]
MRHKILDVLGDFALLGQPIRGRITARATGHRHNVAMVRRMLEARAAA